MTEARTVDPARSSRRKLDITRGVVEPILRWLAGVVAAVIQPIRYFSQPTHPASSDVATEKRAEGVVDHAVVTATADAIARPTTVKSFTAPVTADVMVDLDAQTNRAADVVERLDQAEDYVNDRLAANGEAWRLDSKTRVMLGLPPRVNSAGAPL